MTTIEDRISAALAPAGERLYRHEDGSYSIESAGSIGSRRYGLKATERTGAGLGRPHRTDPQAVRRTSRDPARIFVHHA